MKGNQREKELLELEMTKLRDAVVNVKSKKSDENSIKWSELITGVGRKSMIIGIVLAALNQFSGVFGMVQYTASIFEEAGSNMSPNMSAIVVGVIQLFGSFAPTYLVERAGRKVINSFFQFVFIMKI